MPPVLVLLLITTSCAFVTSVAFANGEAAHKNAEELSRSGRSLRSLGGSYQSIGCRSTDYFCKASQRCIHDFQVCDGVADCSDAQDEENCALPTTSENCTIGHYRCPSTGTCLPVSTLCDGATDCGVFDEPSPITCMRRQYDLTSERCLLLSQKQSINRGRYVICSLLNNPTDNGVETCVYGESICDGLQHCDDNTDEYCSADDEVGGSQDASCPSADGFFLCAVSKLCINASTVCNGVQDCSDGNLIDDSDEEECEACFRCANATGHPSQTCVDRRHMCDGHNDCPLGDDERNCASIQNVRCFARCAGSDGPDTVCLDAADLCDGYRKCADGFDESSDWCSLRACNVTASSSRRRNSALSKVSPQCDVTSTVCRDSPVAPGFVCACLAGYELPFAASGWNSTACQPLSSCRTWGRCSQKCVPDSKSADGYSCACYDGYTLDARNNVSCLPNEQPDLVTLLYLTRQEVRRTEVRTLPSEARQSITVNKLISSNKQASSLDVDIGERLLFWVDVAEDVIYRARLSTGSLTDVRVSLRVGIAAVEGLAVEWITKKLYFVESLLDSIDVANYDGSQRTALVVGSLANPRAIAVDPLRGYLFWTDWEPGRARIERCTLDGDSASRRVLIDVSRNNMGGWPNGLTLDYDSMRIFWVDARSDALYTMTYEGTEVRTLASNSDHLAHPFAITVFDEFLYWTDWRSNRLLRTNKFNANVSITRLDSMNTQPFDVKVLHPLRQRVVANPCAENPCKAPALCFIGRGAAAGAGAKLVPVCRCPYLYEPQPGSAILCRPIASFLLIASFSARSMRGQLNTSIRSYDVELPDRTVAPALFTSAQRVVLAVNAPDQSLIWLEATSSRGLIRRFALNATRRAETIVDRELPNVSALAVDAASRLMYFATATLSPAPARTYDTIVWVATITGAYRMPLLTLRTNGTVSAITLQTSSGRLFFTTLDTLYTAGMDGARLTPLLIAQRSPYIYNTSSLTCDSERNRLFWIAPSGRGAAGSSGSETLLVSYDLEVSKVAVIDLALVQLNSRGAGDMQATRSNASTSTSTSTRRILAISAHRRDLIVALADRVVRVNLTQIGSNSNTTLELDTLRDGVQPLTVSLYDREPPPNTACSNRSTVLCTQLCLPRNASHYTCACVDGFRLASDGAVCQPLAVRFVALLGDTAASGARDNSASRDDSSQTQTTSSLVLSSSTPDSSQFETGRFAFPQVGLTVTAVEFDPVRHRFFFFSNDTRRIVSVGQDLAEQHTVVQGLISSSVRDLAYDWVNENLYVADAAHDVIEAVHVAESERHASRFVVVNSALTRNPHSLVVSPEYNLLCWIESRGKRSVSNSIVCTDLRGYLQARFALPPAHNARSLAIFFGKPHAADVQYPAESLAVVHLIYCDNNSSALYSLNLRTGWIVRRFVHRSDAPTADLDFGDLPDAQPLAYVAGSPAPLCSAGIAVDQATASLYYATGNAAQPLLVVANLSVTSTRFSGQRKAGLEAYLRMGKGATLRADFSRPFLNFRVPPNVTSELVAAARRVSACAPELGCEMCLPTLTNVTQTCSCDFGSWNSELRVCEGVDSVVLFSVRDAIVGVHYSDVSEYADASVRGWPSVGTLNLSAASNSTTTTTTNSSLLTHLAPTGIQLFQNDRMSSVLMLAYSYSKQLLFFSDLHRAEVQALLLGTNLNSLRGGAASSSARLPDELPAAASSHNVLTLFSDVVQPEGLAFDELFSALYFLSASGRTISRFELTSRGEYWRCEEARNLRRRQERGERLSELDRRLIDSCEARVIVRLSEDDKPRSLAVDSCARVLFWANWFTKKPRIQRADLFGRNVTDVVTSEKLVRMPNSVAVDVADRRLYFADALLDHIVSCLYDGSDCRVVISAATGSTGLSHVFSIAVHRQALFWSDWVSNAVYRANKLTGADLQLLRIATEDRRQVMGLLVLDGATQPASQCKLDACEFENGGCDELCGYDDGEVVCSCHSNWLLDPLSKQCHNPYSANNCNTSDVFLCKTGACVPFSLTCDNFPHCADASDEAPAMCMERSCPTGYFQCGNGQCIPLKYRCDGVKHCRDGSEETTNCTCPEELPFRCAEKCISLRSVCDQQIDCVDALDELRSNCGMAFCESPAFSDFARAHGATSPSGFAPVPDMTPSFRFFPCTATSLCFADFQRCDGRDDCGDATDELNCTAINWRNETAFCGANMFTCGSGECVPLSSVCNSVFECRDASDEQACPCPAEKTAQTGYFSCASGGCLSEYRVCDGFNDCLDASDEANCTSIPCSNSSFRCLTTSRCLPAALVCDGNADCGANDRSDELTSECQPVCSRNEVICNDGLYCISLAHYCDQHADCADGSDELNCDYVTCNSSWQFACRSERQCIPLSQKCDGTPQCSDASDEHADVCDELRVDFFNRCGSTGLFFCEPLARCLNSSLVCNRHRDCPDGRDEMLCGLSDQELCDRAVPQCNGTCVVHADRSTRCECPAGMRRSTTSFAGSAAITCHDINECDEGACSQLCVNLQPRLDASLRPAASAGHRCACVEGYALQSDRRTCRAHDSLRPLLVFSSDGALRMRNTLNGEDLPTLFTTSGVTQTQTQTQSIDFLADSPSRTSFAFRLFWTDAQRAVIRTANCSLPTGHVVDQPVCSVPTTYAVELGTASPSLLAVDWVGNNLYWFAEETLFVSTLGSVPMQRTVRAELPDMVALAVHSLRGVLVYADLAEMRVVRLSLDGVYEQVLLDSRVVALPHALAIDVVTDRVYVFDKLSSELLSVALDGTRFRIVAEFVDMTPARALAFFEDSVWLDDAQRVSIFTDQLSTTPSSFQFHPHAVTRPSSPSAASWRVSNSSSAIGAHYVASLAQRVHRQQLGGLALVHPLRQPAQTAVTLCTNCSELCLLRLGGHDAVCVCPDFFVRESSGRCEPRCPDDSFACARSLRCIPSVARCDSVQDCPLGEDEERCNERTYSCNRPRMFVCASNNQSSASQCVQQSAVCNDEADCADASDEAPELCCGPQALVCDTVSTSARSHCVRRSSVCDGYNDCLDGRDESKCNATTVASQNATEHCAPPLFTCTNGRCISRLWVCDLANDCEDGSDEYGCLNGTACSQDDEFWRCDKGQCIKAEWKCDGEYDCGAGDKSDEDERCNNPRTRCAPSHWLCSGNQSRCISRRLLCNGRPDCAGGEDERHCLDGSNATCAEHTAPCADRSRCVPLAQHCDAVSQCDDGSDERDCPQLSNWNASLSGFFPYGKLAEFENSLEYCAPFQLALSRFNKRRAVCARYDATVFCLVTNECKRGALCDGHFDCPYGEDEQFCSAADTCPFAHFKCAHLAGSASGQCVPQTLLCNGVLDCLDGSDESHIMCNNTAHCVNPLARKWPCPIAFTTPLVGKSNDSRSTSDAWPICVRSEQVCDTVTDCAGGSDEDSCSAAAPSWRGTALVWRQPQSQSRRLCEWQTHQWDYTPACGTGSVCIAEHQLCDGYSDCRNKRDELFCSSTSRLAPWFVHSGNSMVPEPDCETNNGFCEQLCFTQPSTSSTTSSYQPAGGRTRFSQPAMPDFGVAVVRKKRTMCACYAGYQLRDDRRTCELLNPCQSHAACTHICRPLWDKDSSKYECHCPAGYVSVDGPLGCRPEVSLRYPKLVMPGGEYFSLLHAFQSDAPSSFSRRVPMPDMRTNALRTFDYDPLTDTLFGITIAAPRIVQVSNFLDSVQYAYEAVKVPPTALGRPIDLVLNWPAQHIYWFDAGLLNEMNVAIKMCPYDGSRVVTVVNITLNTHEVNSVVHGAITIDVVHRQLYFLVVKNDEAWIESATLSGLERKRLRQIVGFPYGLAIDVWNRRLYYTDIANFQVVSTNLDGHQPATVLRYNATLMQETILYVDVAMHALVLTSSKGSLYAVHKFARLHNSTVFMTDNAASSNVTKRQRRRRAASSSTQVGSAIHEQELIRTLRKFEGLEEALTYNNVIFLGGAQAGSRPRTIMQMSDYEYRMIPNPCKDYDCNVQLRGSLCIPRSSSNGGECLCADNEYKDAASTSCRPECNVCQNGGLCSLVSRNGRDVPTCSCWPPFTGDRCADLRCPDGRLCLNNGRCMLHVAIEYGYECSCVPPYSGDNCDILCDLNCGRHGWCTYNSTLQSKHCICNPGNAGSSCEIFVGFLGKDNDTNVSNINFVTWVVVGVVLLLLVASITFIAFCYRRCKKTSMFSAQRFTDEDAMTIPDPLSGSSAVRVISSGRAQAAQSARIVKIRGADVQVQNPIYLMNTENDQLVNEDDCDDDQADEERETALRIDAYFDEGLALRAAGQDERAELLEGDRK